MCFIVNNTFSSLVKLLAHDYLGKIASLVEKNVALHGKLYIIMYYINIKTKHLQCVFVHLRYDLKEGASIRFPTCLRLAEYNW